MVKKKRGRPRQQAQLVMVSGGVPAKIADRIKRMAEADNRSVSQIVRRLIERALDYGERDHDGAVDADPNFSQPKASSLKNSERNDI